VPRPPDAFTPFPLAWPGAVSTLAVCRGCPSYVAWIKPPVRVIWPTAPVTPAPAAAGPVTGGQRRAPLSVQCDLATVSGANQ
jgi:hypothetical protein